MKQRIKIVANDGETKIVVSALIDHTGALSSGEQRGTRKSAIRHISEALTNVRWTDYGIENIKVK